MVVSLNKLIYKHKQYQYQFSSLGTSVVYWISILLSCWLVVTYCPMYILVVAALWQIPLISWNPKIQLEHLPSLS